MSLFGPVKVERSCFWVKSRGGQIPMDAVVNLSNDAYSDLLREQVDLLSAQMAYGETTAVIQRLLCKVADEG